VRRYGKSFAHPLIVLIASHNEQEQTRLAVVAGRSLGNAVQRNRAKRLLRAAMHPMLEHIEPGWDVLLLARRSMNTASFQDTQAVLLGLLTRAHLLQVPHEP
jgi:ribonuclease P protein component